MVSPGQALAVLAAGIQVRLRLGCASAASPPSLAFSCAQLTCCRCQLPPPLQLLCLLPRPAPASTAARQHGGQLGQRATSASVAGLGGGAAGGPAGACAHAHARAHTRAAAHARGYGLRLAGAPHVAIMVERFNAMCMGDMLLAGKERGKAVHKLVRVAVAQQLPWAACILSLQPSPIHLQERQVARCDQHAAHECARHCAQDHARQSSLPPPPLPSCRGATAQPRRPPPPLSAWGPPCPPARPACHWLQRPEAYGAYPLFF